MPRRSIFSIGNFVSNKNQYEAFLSLVETVKHHFRNTLTSDEDRQAAADERKRQEQMTANMHHDIRQQAKQMAELMIQQTIDALDDKKQEYEKLCKKQKGYIIRCANKIAVHISKNFAKLSADHQNKLIERSYNELDFENIEKEMEEEDDEISY